MIIEKEIDDIDYYSDFYLGVRIFEKNNPFFKELKYREDAVNKLNNKIKKEKISKNKESLFILVNLLNEGSDYYNELYIF